MRSVGHMRLALDMMCERALSRFTQGERLAEKQLVQEMIAEAWMAIEQFRLLVLQTAWKIDNATTTTRRSARTSPPRRSLASRALADVATKALQIHGSLGISDEMPFVSMLVNGLHVGLADGPDRDPQDHGRSRSCSRRSPAHDGLFPSQHIPALAEQAREALRRDAGAAWPMSQG